MFNYPFNKYDYYTTPNGDTIAVSTYAGRTVRGIAHKAQDDTENPEIGRTVAAHRCNIKVAERRYKNAQKRHDLALAQYVKAKAFLDKMEKYENDAEDAWNDAEYEYEQYMMSLQ